MGGLMAFLVSMVFGLFLLTLCVVCAGKDYLPAKYSITTANGRYETDEYRISEGLVSFREKSLHSEIRIPLNTIVRIESRYSEVEKWTA